MVNRCEDSAKKIFSNCFYSSKGKQVYLQRQRTVVVLKFKETRKVRTLSSRIV